MDSNGMQPQTTKIHKSYQADEIDFKEIVISGGENVLLRKISKYGLGEIASWLVESFIIEKRIA